MQNNPTGAEGLSPTARRSGQGASAVIFWLLGIALLLGPFLRAPFAAAPEGDDAGRKLSLLDIPFSDSVGQFEATYGLDLAGAIESASEEWFGMNSDRLRATGLVQQERLEAGRFAYERFCIGCHGSSGDGAGPAAPHLSPRPRNFRRSIFKFTSTSSGTPPQRADLFQTITRGLSGSSMPDFRLVSEERRWDLVEFVRYVAIRGWFEQLMLEEAQSVEGLPEAQELAEIVVERWSEHYVKSTYPPIMEIEKTPESIARGQAIFSDPTGANCVSCHGLDGKGGGPAAGEFKDAWGYPIAPRDLTTGVFRAGSAPSDLYRSISSGVGGTPMPSYEGAIPAEDIWSLVHYIQSLGVKQ